MADATCCSCGNCADCGFVTRKTAEAVADQERLAHGAIRERLIESIVETQVFGERPLAKLTTRDPGDPTIALIDSWAGALHVLGWNARRLHEDGNFHQSEDRDAMAAHAQMLGYRPRPILAAQTVQTFMVDEIAALEGPFEVPIGTKIASVPLGQELPQIFETDFPLEARLSWNKFVPVRATDHQAFTLATSSILLEGNASFLQAGQMLLLPDSQTTGDSVLLAPVSLVETEQDETDKQVRTRVTLSGIERLEGVPDEALPEGNELVVLGKRASVFGANAPDYKLVNPDDEKTKGVALKRASKKGVGSTMGAMNEGVEIDHLAEGVTGLTQTEWEEFVVAAPPDRNPESGNFDLDAEYAEALPDRLILFDAGSTGGTGSLVGKAKRKQLGLIDTSEVLTRNDFALSQKATRVTVGTFNFKDNLPGGTPLNKRVRESTVLIETMRLSILVPLLDEPLPKTGEEDRLLLAGEHDLPPGRLVTLTGHSADHEAGEVWVSEVATVLSADVAEAGSTLVVFEGPLVNRYWSSSLSVYGNCVTASHAETAGGGNWEVLGSGQRGVQKPVFALKQGPLARLPAVNERGFAPAIEVRVDGRKYDYAETLFGVDAEAHKYTIETAPEGKERIRFAGALPSGLNNVMAFYRFGGGMAGNLMAGRITTILSPVIGIATSENHVAAEGGMAAETLEDIRLAAPRNVAALGRVVSRVDYESFARGFRGVGKAMATHLQEGMRTVVCLTIATSIMEPPEQGSTLLTGLADTLAQATPPGQDLRIEGFEDETVTLVAALKVDEAIWRRGDVEQAARLHLAQTFGRENMHFGRPMRASEILAALHDVSGVIAARIEVLDSPSSVPDLDDIPARIPQIDPVTAQFREATLLALDEASISFTEMA